ncbi:MAG: hypothetical protein KAU16_08745 [Methanophagales archaeon]|nr:hypothetical protein [Methanophagales archaeon]
MPMKIYKHREITEKIIGAAQRVHNTLGYGFLEKVYQNLIADVMNEKYSSNEVTEKRDSLLSGLNEILENAPSTDSKAYSKARKALKIHEEMRFSNKEIDDFLPEELRIERMRNVK